MTCGVCLRDNVDVINIFGEEGKRLDISAIIRQHFWFEPIEDDTILSHICWKCWKQIANFHVFYTNVKTAHKKLSERYYSNQQYTGEYYNYSGDQSGSNAYEGLSNSNYNYEDSGENNLEEVVSGNDLYFKSEHYGGHVYDETYYQGEKRVNEESYEVVETHEDDKYLLERSNYESPEICEENINPYGAEPNLLSLRTDATIQSKNKTNSTNSSQSDKINENKIKEEDELIAKYIKLKCEVCGEHFSIFQELRRHYRNMHSMFGYARCCDKKLPSRAYVLDHINKHINPDSYKCRECNKVFSSQYAIKNHLAKKHVPETEKIYSCEFCPEKFSNQHALNQHSTRHLSEEEKRTYCIDCRKTFPTPLALQMHKNVYHGQLQGHICHVCGKIIKGKAIFAKHVNDHATELGQETINEPVCPICGKLSASIKTLRHHIRYVHSSHRPHKCNICGKAFKIRQKLKEHMGSHAVGNPIPCPYCHKRFRSKIHLYSHKYRMHKQKYEEEKQIRFQMMTETFCGNSSISECYVQQYDDNSIVLSGDSDDCYVVA